MNDAQTQLNSTGGSQLSQTQNPQTIGEQSLVDQRNDLQTANGNALATPQARITSVGSVQFAPVSVTTTSTISVATPKNTFSARPLLIAVSITFACIAVLLFIVMNGSGRSNTKHT